MSRPTDTHPNELLPDYALGMLDAGEHARVDAHLASCETCQAEMRRYRASLAGLVEALPETAPPEGAWEGVAARLEPSRPQAPSQAPWRVWAMAASLVLALGGAWWGYSEYRLNEQLQAEQQRVARWLAQPEVEMQPLQTRAGERLGGILFLPDGRALFVLDERPESGKAYQAWGHRGDSLTSLEVSERPVFEVRWQGFETLYLSLEPESGSPQPTEGLSRIEVLAL